ncbi:MAG: tetratricopeptide repeat protein, partial [Blastocatellia bacterium]|nr:tetratricopeptide repeat protein [Blastocatellia bacterium]
MSAKERSAAVIAGFVSLALVGTALDRFPRALSLAIGASPAFVEAAPRSDRSSLWHQAPQESAKAAPSVEELVPGAPVERELSGGEAHVYRLTLAAGQYARVTVVQQGIDVVVRLFGPDGQQIVEMDSSTGTQGEEIVSHVADVTGAYRIEVAPLEKDAPKGRYAIRLAELRPANEQDRTRVAAERAFAEAVLLNMQETAESLRRALAKYEEAARLYHALGERSQEAMCLLLAGIIAHQIGERQKALEYLNQALPIFRTVGDRAMEAATLIGIGAVYNALGERQKALEYLNQALPIFRAVGNQAGEATTLTGIGRVYADLGERQKALEYYNQALAIHRAVGDRAEEATTLTNIGVVYATLGERQKAL